MSNNRWGNQPHGSAWVYRQAKQFLCEEFSQLINSPLLSQIDKSHLIDCLQSDFLQASELEILQAVLNWAESKLIKRMEEKGKRIIFLFFLMYGKKQFKPTENQISYFTEPNVLNQAPYSVNRKNARKRDVSDVDMREILSELLPFVRMDHVIPPSSELLNQAIRRGLVSTPPSHMIGTDLKYSKVHAWIRSQTGLFVRPRLFMPYYEEIKVGGGSGVKSF